MSIAIERQIRKRRRKSRVRKKISGNADRPRLSVARSLKNICAQLIDDERMVTLAFASSLTNEIADKLSGKNKVEKAAVVGDEIAKKALASGIKRIVFDRGGRLYHGRVKVLAEAVRKAGLEF